MLVFYTLLQGCLLWSPSCFVAAKFKEERRERYLFFSFVPFLFVVFLVDGPQKKNNNAAKYGQVFIITKRWGLKTNSDDKPGDLINKKGGLYPTGGYPPLRITQAPHLHRWDHVGIWDPNLAGSDTTRAVGITGVTGTEIKFIPTLRVAKSEILWWWLHWVNFESAGKKLIGGWIIVYSAVKLLTSHGVFII